MKKEKILPHILLCYDGSPSGYKGLRYVEQVFEKSEIGVTLLRIIDSPKLHPSLSTDLKKRFFQEDEVEETANKLYKEHYSKLQEVAELLKSKTLGKVEVKVVFKQGEIFYDIVRIAQEGLYDAIVVGRRGLSRISSFILGSITQKLVYSTSFPIWIIRGDSWNKKLFAGIELNEMGIRVIDYVSFILAYVKSVKPVFCHIYHPFSPFEDFRGSLEELLKVLKEPEVREYFLKVREIFKTNDFDENRAEFVFKRSIFGTAGQIIRMVKKEGFSTIVIGRKGKSKLREIFLGSVSQKLISYFEDKAIWIVH